MTTAYLRKYFIMGSQNCEQNPATILQAAIDAGITAFQFREKGENSLQGEAKLTLGRQLREICRVNDIPFIINNDRELIEALGVDGIHVGQSDTSVKLLREKFPDLIIGLSISNIEELENSQLQFVDYIGAGAIFTTNSKADAKQAVGIEWIQELRKLHADIPIVGIGGITQDNANQVIKAGANGVAVISAIAKAQDIKLIVSKL